MNNVSSLMVCDEEYISLFNREVFNKNELLRRIHLKYPKYPKDSLDYVEADDLPSYAQLAKIVLPYFRKFVAIIGMGEKQERYAIKQIGEFSVNIQRRSDQVVNTILLIPLVFKLKNGTVGSTRPSKLMETFQTYNLVVNDVVFSPFPPMKITPSMTSVYEKENILYLNSYCGLKWEVPECIALVDTELDAVQLFLNHLKFIICDGDETVYKFFLRWLVSKIQYPHQKIDNCPVIIGDEGAGKGIFLNMLVEMMGVHGRVIKMNSFKRDFNPQLDQLILGYIEEFKINNKYQLDDFKHMMTQNEETINEKNRMERRVRFYGDFIASSNWLKPTVFNGTSRRFCLWSASNKYAPTGSNSGDNYFEKFASTMYDHDNKGIKAVLGYLCVFDLKKYETENKLKSVRKEMPRTKLLQINQVGDLNSVESYWLTVMRRGWTMDLETLYEIITKMENFNLQWDYTDTQKDERCIDRLHELLEINFGEQLAAMVLDQFMKKRLSKDYSRRKKMGPIYPLWISTLCKPYIYYDYTRTMQKCWKDHPYLKGLKIEDENMFWENSSKIVKFETLKDETDRTPGMDGVLIRQDSHTRMVYLDVGNREALIKSFEKHTCMKFDALCKIVGFYYETQTYDSQFLMKQQTQLTRRSMKVLNTNKKEASAVSKPPLSLESEVYQDDSKKPETPPLYLVQYDGENQTFGKRAHLNTNQSQRQEPKAKRRKIDTEENDHEPEATGTLSDNISLFDGLDNFEFPVDDEFINSIDLS